MLIANNIWLRIFYSQSNFNNPNFLAKLVHSPLFNTFFSQYSCTTFYFHESSSRIIVLFGQNFEKNPPLCIYLFINNSTHMSEELFFSSTIHKISRWPILEREDSWLILGNISSFLFNMLRLDMIILFPIKRTNHMQILHEEPSNNCISNFAFLSNMTKDFNQCFLATAAKKKGIIYKIS